MDSDAEAAAAIAALNGWLQTGQVVRVCVATARHELDADHTSLFGPMNMTVNASSAAVGVTAVEKGELAN